MNSVLRTTSPVNSTPASRESVIRVELMNIANALDEQRKIIEVLKDKFIPVLSPLDEKSSESSSPPSSIPLVADLGLILNRIRNHSYLLSSLIEHCEL